MDKVAVVLGTSSGIGETIAKLLLDLGYSVYGGSRRESKIDHENFVDIEIDITNKGLIKSFIKEVSSDYEGIDLFINTVGLCELNAIKDTTDDEISSLFETNVIGAFNFLKHLEPLLITGETQILNLLSISANSIFENTLSFTLSEQARNAMIKTFEKEWKKYDLRFSYLYLGAIDTPLWDEYRDLDRTQMMTVNDLMYFVRTVVEAPRNVKIHGLTLTHIRGFID